jgi:membrane protein required for colicin V production
MMVEGWLAHITPFDYAIIALIALSIIFGFIRGFIKESLTVGSWLLAIAAGLMFGQFIADYSNHWFDSPLISAIFAWLVVIISSLIFAAMLNQVLRQMVIRLGLTGIDRLLGIWFGLLRGLILLCLFIIVLDVFGINDSSVLNQSYLINRFKPVANELKMIMPQLLHPF